MKIYYKDGDKAKNIEELILNGYKNGVLFVQTFKDPKFNKLQCHNAYRSFLDLYWICKTYFPKTIKKELAKLLFKLAKENGLHCSYCSTIHKLVFRKEVGYLNRELGTYLTLDVKNLKGSTKYSFNEIEKLANS